METSGLSIVLSNLQVFTRYAVTVSASTSAGMGPPATETERTDSTSKPKQYRIANHFRESKYSVTLIRNAFRRKYDHECDVIMTSSFHK